MRSIILMSWLVTFMVCVACPVPSHGQLPEAPPSPGPDDRYKADILLVVAHPDDETAVSGYLARAIFDEHKRVAVIFGTRGDAGGNAMGYEQAAALGAEREIEARRALASFGVMNVWFLRGPDTAGQDVLRSLETWHHGEALADTVRLVRLTRPEVILTWLPDYVAGENHGDHQAAGVIATEAYDLAGDPTVLAEQVTPPRDRFNIENLTEGLQPWQPQKIYYFSDASHTDFLEGKGPKYSTLDESPSRHIPYYRLAAEEMRFHLTQGDTGQLAKEAFEKGDFRYFQEPVRLIFGKSLVKLTTTGDISEGLATTPLPYAPVRGYQAVHRKGVSLELGGPWAFYREFWKAHSIEHLADLIPKPEVSITSGTRLHVPILIHNDSDAPVQVALTISIPKGWVEERGSARFPVAPHDAYPVEVVLLSPGGQTESWQDITLKGESDGSAIGSITLKVKLTTGGLPQ